MSDPKPGDLRVWWVPQVPGVSFFVLVDNVQDGKRIMGILATYDAFQYANRIKLDYCNAGGIQVYEADVDGSGEPGWTDIEESEDE